MNTIDNDRTRWLALYVLCAGMLMIVLDATIVNVALPSIQDDLGFSQSNLAWVVNAYLIPFGGLLLLAGRMGDLLGQRRVFLDRPGDLHRRLAALRRLAEPGDADRRPLHPGRRRRARLGRDPGDDRDDVPRAAASRRKRSASTASSPPPAARSACCSAASSPTRSAGTGSSSSTCRSGSPPPSWRCGWSPTRTGSASARAPTSPAPLLLTSSLMLGVFTILQIDELGLGRQPARSSSARSRPSCWRSSSSARRGSPTR